MMMAGYEKVWLARESNMLLDSSRLDRSVSADYASKSYPNSYTRQAFK